jgi:hypothetical protein
MFHGPPIDDVSILDLLPEPYARLLRSVNGYIAYHGGLHVRGACHQPTWHSLRYHWLGDGAIHKLYPALTPDDVPFAEDALGDQFIVRDGIVHRLAAETGELASLSVDLPDFDAAVQADPVQYLQLQPLQRVRAEGKSLEPGQLLSVLPPFVLQTKDERSFEPVDGRAHLEWLADFARQIRDLPDGGQVILKPV